MGDDESRSGELLADEPEPTGEVSRRRLIAGAGGAVAGGLLVIGVPDAAVAARTKKVGAGRSDRRSVGLLGQINQEGPNLEIFGYLTRIQGLGISALYTSPPAINSNDPRASDPGPARFTFFNRATMTSMSRRNDVLSATANGTVTIFHQPDGGADFDDPGSFADGKVIAEFKGSFRDDLLLDGENQGALVMSGDLTQSRAPRFDIAGKRARFGKRGLPWHVDASGRGIRTEPTIPRAVISISGDLGVIDAEVIS